MQRSSQSKGLAAATVLVFALCLTSCHEAGARSESSFDEIHRMVAGRTADEVIQMLGEPDSRQSIFGDDEKWIYWGYTFLDGKDYPPEMRGRVVHLEIIFSNPARSGEPSWRVDGDLAVNYRIPSSSGES